MIDLRAGNLRLVLDPAFGAAILRFDCAETPILRPAPPAVRDPTQAAAFLMAPFVNRIAFGRFRFDGVDYAIPPDPAGAPHALHGDAWRRPWRVDSVNAHTAALSLDDGEAWPWKRRIEQTIALTPDGLTIEAAIANTDARPMPAGLGWHPTFARRAEAHLQLAATGWHPTMDDLPGPAEPLPPRWPFTQGLAAAALAPIDHCLTGWSGAAAITWPDFSLHLEARGCPFLHVYAPPGEDGFCLEPQTSAPNAVHGGAAFGLHVLPPGGRLAIGVRLTIT